MEDDFAHKKVIGVIVQNIRNYSNRGKLTVYLPKKEGFSILLQVLRPSNIFKYKL